MREITLNGRRYRTAINPNKGKAEPWAALEAEYWCELTQEWRQVHNWNTRERLYIQGYGK